MPENLATETTQIRVSTLELFFDLVFVFTITQLAATLYEHLDLATLGNVVLILAVIWWMYSGYAWLTNAIAPNSTTRRTLLLTGMAGFLVMALAIPHAFGRDGWLFGVSYLVVNLVHTALFRQAGTGARQAIQLTAPLNVVAALLVLVGGFLPGPGRYLCWAAAPVVQISAGYLIRGGTHTLDAGHLAERHGLVVIVAIGESIVAIGVGFRDVKLGAGAILVAVLGLGIAYYLWWFYFAGDDERAEHVLARTPAGKKSRLAMHAYEFAHVPMLLGIVILSVGIHRVVGRAFEALPWPDGIALAGGVALYLIGHAAFLWLFGLPGVPHRLGAAAVVLATIPLGHLIAIAQLAAIPITMVAAATIEDVLEVRRTGRTEIRSFGRTAGPE